jgi:hypothetical protein
LQTHIVLAILTRIKCLFAHAVEKIAEKGGAMRGWGGRCVRRFLPGLVAAALFGLTVPVADAADDAYLLLLDAELTKVEGVSTDTPGDGVAPSGVTGESASTPSREHFESLLREQHLGTYSFYRRLPERSREEIFIDYSNGASTAALRDKIVDRFLHP